MIEFKTFKDPYVSIWTFCSEVWTYCTGLLCYLVSIFILQEMDYFTRKRNEVCIRTYKLLQTCLEINL